MSLAEFEADVVVDARNCILGRVASEVAQRAIEGERIAVVNAEDAVITGSEEDVSSTARKKIEQVGDAVSLEQYIEQNPEGSNVRVIR